MTAQLLFHPRISVTEAARLAAATGQVLATDRHGGVTLKVRCAACKHHQPDYNGIDIGWCPVQHQYRALRFPRTCRDYQPQAISTPGQAPGGLAHE